MRKCGVVAMAAIASVALAGCCLCKCKHAAAGKETAAAGKFVLRVTAGISEPYTDKAGNVWKGEKEYSKEAGFGFVGGLTVDRTENMKIEGTNDPRVYQTEHYSMTGFVADVPNGKYSVRLHFAETYDGVTSAGGRVFDVTIQGKTVLQDFDVFKEAGGAQKAVVREFKSIEVTNGKIEIGFVPKQQNPEINGIELLGE